MSEKIVDVAYEITHNVLKPPSQREVEIVKEEILGGRGMILYNVLTPEECDFFRDQAVELGMQPVAGDSVRAYKKSYRNNDRVSAKGDDVAELLWERVKSYIPSSRTVELTPENITIQGKWEAMGLNEVFRICKYDPGGHFSPHYDGDFRRNPNERSFLTFMLYLNSDYEGGTTNFLRDDTQHVLQEDGHYCAAEDKIISSVKAKQGMAIIFDHHVFHEGGQLKSGQKYIMRSEVMFKRVECGELTAQQEEAIQELEKAKAAETAGDLDTAVKHYRRTYKLWPELEFAN
eukprot:TRINITY_DN61187_c0_g1_i1.p1 TRINITY_DN61187_c0_g1~~TRINITY_DN61187_c0_g1_i1.p1  ORF type:complete len:310 (+),score=62.95 TRINITY_DN61187_c0_g1_i1:65-931(+)